jgi:bacteriorhodopsin
MKSEMDVMKLDERQRLSWLLANRATLMIVGLVWVGMAIYELIQSRRPYFLLIMIPAFALIRFAFYKIYAHKTA